MWDNINDMKVHHISQYQDNLSLMELYINAEKYIAVLVGNMWLVISRQFADDNYKAYNKHKF